MSCSMNLVMPCPSGRSYQRCSVARAGRPPWLPADSAIIGAPGRLAQLGERFVYTEEVAGSSPAPPISDCRFLLRVYGSGAARSKEGGELMLWLIAGIVLLVIAIAGGAIIHPVLFALAIVALLIFFMGRGTRTV